MKIKKVRADQLYYISLAIPKALEAMLQELWAQLSEENYELAMELLKQDIAGMQTQTLLLEIRLTDCLEQVETDIAIEDEEE